MKILLEPIFENGFVEDTSKCILYAILGLLLGITINLISKCTIHSLKISRLLRVFIQLVYCSMVFAFIKQYVSDRLVNNWINSVQGLFFVSVFFGVQYEMFTEIQSYTNSLVPNNNK